MKISKTTLVVIIYIIGVILGAFFLDIWGAETSMKKGFIALGWTALFRPFLFSTVTFILFGRRERTRTFTCCHIGS